MKLFLLFFDLHSLPYFHICESVVHGSNRYFRNDETNNYLSIVQCDFNNVPYDSCSITDKALFNYLMNKYGTLDGTYAEIEL